MADADEKVFDGKPCRRCGGTLRYIRQHQSCVACQRIRYRARYRADPAGNMARNKLRRRRRRLLAASRPMPPGCEMCGSAGHLCFDHDHQTGLFRGWLCNACNRGLGCLGDHIHTAMARLARYAAIASIQIPETQ